jgi:aqualysin 1
MKRYTAQVDPTRLHVGEFAAELVREGGGIVHHFTWKLHQLDCSLPDELVAEFEANPAVIALDLYVEPVNGAEPTTQTLVASQPGLDRISQRDLPLDGVYQYEFTGAGVTGYLVESQGRPNLTHPDIAGRISNPMNITTTDAHALQVSSMITGTICGVAKDTQLIALQPAAGMSWMVDNHPDGLTRVANHSYTGQLGITQAERYMATYKAGVLHVVIVDNQNSADIFSPGFYPGCLVISGTLATDARSTGNGNSPNVSVWAVRQGNYMANGTSAFTNTQNGTSFACPQITGIAALLLEAHPGAPPQELEFRIMRAATRDKVTGTNVANRQLAYSFEDGPPFRCYWDHGDYVVPEGTGRIVIEAWGAGGAGGAVGMSAGNEDLALAASWGGGGGAYSRRTITVAEGDVVSFTVAATRLGSNNAVGQAGGDTLVYKNGTLVCRAKGGKGGTASAAGAGGLASECLGDVAFSGGAGGKAGGSGADDRQDGAAPIEAVVRATTITHGPVFLTPARGVGGKGGAIARALNLNSAWQGQAQGFYGHAPGGGGGPAVATGFSPTPTYRGGDGGQGLVALTDLPPEDHAPAVYVGDQQAQALYVGDTPFIFG